MDQNEERQVAWEGRFKDVFVACDTLNVTLGSCLYELGRCHELHGDTALTVSVTVRVEDDQRQTLEEKVAEMMETRKYR